jgi:hypothetical protein
MTADQNNSTIATIFPLPMARPGQWRLDLSGNLGAGVTRGRQTVTWNAGTDFANQNLATMKVRVRGRDTFNNQSANVESASFDLDTLPPATLVAADLKAQPLAGATTVLIGGSFTEAHPDTNAFSVALNGGAYGSAAAGASNTAAPADLLVAAGATLDGNDYISQVKIVHTDDYNRRQRTKILHRAWLQICQALHAAGADRD